MAEGMSLPKTGPELVRYYNEQAEKLGAEKVKRFASVAAGIARCQKIDEAVRAKDIVPTEAEDVSAAPTGTEQSETTTGSKEVDMSTSMSFERHIVEKKSPPKGSTWTRGPAFRKESNQVKLIAALSSKALTIAEMSRAVYKKENKAISAVWSGVKKSVDQGFLKMKIEEGTDAKTGNKTFRLRAK